MPKRIAAIAVFAAIGTFGTALYAVPNPDTVPEEDRPVQVKREPEKINPSSTHFYLNGGVGYGGVGLNTFQSQQNGDQFTADLVPTRAGGPAVDLGLGFRLAILTLGVRGSLLALQDQSAERTVGSMQLWNLDAELGLRLPLGRVEPSLLVRGGYSKFGGLGDALVGVQRGLNIDGANLGLGLGLDYFATQHFSIGARGTADLLFLSRESVPLRDLAKMEEVGTISEAKARALEGNGTTVGWAYALVIGPGVHF